jgi:hypothetical protein
MHPKSHVGARMRLTQLAAAVIASTALIACGGGGSGNAVVDKAGLALYTSATPSITVAGGASATYSIGGGGGGSQFVSYQASSSNAQIATAKVDGNKLTVTGLVGGTATITVTDNAGANVAINVTVPTTAIPSLSIAAPASVTLVPGTTTQYKVAGGVGPYTVVASNPNVAAVAAGSNVVSVTAANPGTATIVVFDSRNVSSKFDLTVSGANTAVNLYTTAPETVSLPANTSTTYAIAGGVPPYTATSSVGSIVDASVNGTILTLTSKAQVGKAVVDIRDAQGTLVTVTANVTGAAPVPLYTTAPSNISVGLGVSPTYSIQGGIGPFTATSSNASVLKASVTGNTLNITGLSAGVADVVIFDSTGASVKVSATVQGGSATVPLYSTAPESITVSVGAMPTYTIAGGASPYTVTSSNVNVITVSQTGNTFTATGVAAGLATITIHDANGTAVNIMVTVQ